MMTTKSFMVIVALSLQINGQSHTTGKSLKFVMILTLILQHCPKRQKFHAEGVGVASIEISLTNVKVVQQVSIKTKTTMMGNLQRLQSARFARLVFMHLKELIMVTLKKCRLTYTHIVLK